MDFNIDTKELDELLKSLEQSETNNSTSSTKVRISADRMEAYITLAIPAYGEEYTDKQLLDILKEYGVKQGIDKEQIQRIISEQIYGTEIKVATGKGTEDGKDGYYEFFFDDNDFGKPLINDDDSVDYMNIKLFTQVEKGDIIAKYHPAVAGKFGFGVDGKLMTPKKAIDLPPLRGTGFTMSDDRLVYTAYKSGRITKKAGTIDITNLIIIRGNVDLSVGNINFAGDVTINGDVCAGFQVTATGVVEICGSVEQNCVITGENVIIKKGVLGGNSGIINAKENIYGNFFENVVIRTDGNVYSNYLLNCDVKCNGVVNAIGAKGIILGGSIRAVCGIEAHYIGNEAGMTTLVGVGIQREISETFSNISKQITKVESEIQVFENGRNEFVNKLSCDELVGSAMYNKILMAISMKTDELNDLVKKRAILAESINKGQGAQIKVNRTVYPGTILSVDQYDLKIPDRLNNVFFVDENKKITVYKKY